MKNHLSKEKYDYMMSLRGKLNPNSRISYAGKPVEPPKVLYANIQPVSYIAGDQQGIMPGECPSPGPECDKWRRNMMQRENKPNLGKGFLILILLILTLTFIFSSGK